MGSRPKPVTIKIPGQNYRFGHITVQTHTDNKLIKYNLITLGTIITRQAIFEVKAKARLH